MKSNICMFILYQGIQQKKERNQLLWKDGMEIMIIALCCLFFNYFFSVELKVKYEKDEKIFFNNRNVLSRVKALNVNIKSLFNIIIKIYNATSYNYLLLLLPSISNTWRNK